MKKLSLIALTVLIPVFTMAQNPAIENLFEKYQGTEGFTTVLVTQDAFKFISSMESGEGELDKPLGKIKNVKVLAQEDENVIEGLNFYDELKGELDFSQYKELVVVKEQDQDVWIIAKENNGRLAELLVIVGGEENVLVWIEGDFTLEDMAELSKLGGIEELKVLEEL
jgi:hypothetical protein